MTAHPDEVDDELGGLYTESDDAAFARIETPEFLAELEASLDEDVATYIPAEEVHAAMRAMLAAVAKAKGYRAA